MKKIPSLFLRDFAGNPALVTRAPNPECVWVFAGEGVATRKWDGTALLIRDGAMFRRYDAKAGRKMPVGFEPAQDPDLVTGHWPGWVPVGWGKDGDPYREAKGIADWANGTYELCGPKINGNPEGFVNHCLLRHGAYLLWDIPRTYDGLAKWLGILPYEGIVWHHPDGRMAKVKRRDFGLLWPIPGSR